jgi:PTS system nitrogen regulatory IIA component
MQLTDFITLDRILSEMESTTKRETLAEIARLAGRGLPAVALDEIVRVLTERERLASTGIGEGIAIPHGKLDHAESLVLALARSRKGVDFESIDGRPTRLFFALIAPTHSTGMHLKALARISRLCKEPLFLARLLEAPDSAGMLEVLALEDGKFRVP